MKRSKVPAKYKWDLSSYCKDDEEFFSRIKLLEGRAEEIKSFEGRLNNEELLLKLLNLDSEISRELEVLGNFAARRLDEDLSSSSGQQLESEFSRVATVLSVAGSYITPEISKFSNEKLEKLKKNPKFFHFKLYFRDIIKSKPHILKGDQEKMISGMGEFLGASSDCFDAFSDADLKFDDVLDSRGRKRNFNQELYGVYMRSKDRTLRENAIRRINGTFGKFSNLLTKNYLAKVKKDCYFAKLRNYPSALARAIDAEDASQKVYENLIDCVRKNIKIMHRFAELKRQKLGLDKFAIYDQSAPVGKALNKKYTFDEAYELFKASVSVLGQEYGKILDKAKAERWIDVMPNDGKATGSVETLAHEMGHSMHTYFSSKHQIFEESGYVIFVAEVASTVNEMLLSMHMLKNCRSKKEKLAIIDNLFVGVRSTIFRQTMFAEFEEWVHAECEAGRPLSKDLLCKKYYDLNKFYFGPKVKLVDEIQYEWSRIPHFYRSFYVYKYATGLISALNIVNAILSGKEGALEKYLNFLCSGCTKPPVELLKDAGCDLENPQTFDEVFEFLNVLLDEYAKL